MFKHLLVPTDGSELSQQAVRRAIAFAREAGAKITFFCAEKPFPFMYASEGTIFDGHALLEFQHSEEAVAHALLDACRQQAQAAGVDCATLVLFCEAPYEAIIAAAQRQDCDLIFMASHGQRGVKGLLLGSETQKVLTHCGIPVLVYRQPR